jgi:hypothetical protein
MRLVERTLRDIRIAPRQPEQDALGGMTEGFSSARIACRCAAAPAGNTLNYAANGITPLEHGEYRRQGLKLLLPRGTQIAPGDGVCMEGEEAPGWRCVAVEAWPSHVEAKIERLA